ncbi:uncharacterized protein LOC144102800 [Amblyomma americanum]
MTQDASQQTSQSAMPSLVLSSPRDPGTFSGTDNVDVDDWINMYEPVSTYNRWDPTLMLANVIFYLKDTARVWYETREDDLTRWDVYKQKLRELFGRPLGRTLAAKRELASRAQTSTESNVSYIQDMLALCHKVDNNMPESDKVGHVLKGIADDAFNLLVCKNCTTVEGIIKECRRFEEAKGRRISQPYTRLPNTAATSSCEDLLHRQTPAPPENVTRIIRSELEAMSPASLPLLRGLLAVAMPEGVSLQAYADDVVYLVPGASRNELEQLADDALGRVAAWGDGHTVPTVHLGGARPSFRPAVKVLGVVFDRTLSFIPHAERLKERAETLTARLATFSLISCTPAPARLRLLCS